MKAWRFLGPLVLAGLIGTALAPQAQAAPGDPLTLSSATAKAGDTITVSGTGCEPGFQHESAEVLVWTTDASQAVGTTVTKSSDLWSVKLTIPKSAKGKLVVHASCESYSGQYHDLYETATVSVQAEGPQIKLTADKATATVGESVTLSGTGCTVAGAEVVGFVRTYTKSLGYEFSAKPDAKGTWTTKLTPATQWGLPESGGSSFVVFATCAPYADEGFAYSDFDQVPVVTVPYSLKVLSTPSKAVSGQTVNVKASIAGVGEGQAVKVQFQSGSSWLTSQTRTTGSDSSVTIPLTYGQGNVGTYTYRLVTGNGKYTTYSPTYKIVRTPASVTGSAPSAAKVGQTVSVSVKVSGSGWGVPVQTQFLLRGKWTTSRTGSTNGRGEATIPLTYGQNALGTNTWRVVASYGGSSVVSSSKTLTRVASEVKVVSAPSSAKKGKAVSVKLSVAGVGSGQSVAVQILSNGKWVTSRSAKTNSRGEVTIPLTYGQGSVFTFTWRAQTTISGVSVTSRNVKLTRTR